MFIGNVVLLAPRVAPTLKNATALNSTAVVVEWIPINNTHEVVIGYTITWHRQGHNRVNNISSNASSSSVVITGLRKYTNYSITIAAYNSMGAGPESEMTVVQTEADGKNIYHYHNYWILFIYVLIYCSILFLYLVCHVIQHSNVYCFIFFMTS